MCVVSMVMDHYKGSFDQYTVPFDQWVIGPAPGIGGIHSAPSDNSLNGPVDLTPQFEEIKQLIKDFRVAVEAARTVDALTNQPDCVDPEKVKLEAKVAELEARIAVIEKSTKKTKRTKKGK